MSRSHQVVRRSATYAAGAALAAGALVAGSGAADAAPADPDVSGIITNSVGQPLPGAFVFAYTIGPNGFDNNFADSAEAGPDGRFTLTGLDAASLAGDPDTAGQTQFKLFFSDGRFPSPTVGARPARYKSVWYGGFEAAPPSATVTVPAGATTPVVANQALVTTAGLAVTIIGPAGAPVTDGDAVAYDGKLKSLTPFTSALASGDVSDDDDAYDNPATPQTEVAPNDGVALVSGLDAGKPVKVLASGYTDNAAPAPDVYYTPRFFGNTTSLEDTKTVLPTVGGYTPLAIQLGASLVPDVQPTIEGDASFGSLLTANPGEWVSAFGNLDYNYQWYRGSALVASGPTYLVTKADKKKKIKLVVTAYEDGANLVGQAATKATPKAGLPSKTKAKKGKNGTVNVVVKAKKAKGKKGKGKKAGAPTGKVVLITDEGKKASKKVKLKGGKATLTARSKFAGEDLTVQYLGGGKLGPSTDAVGGGGGKGGKKKKG